MPLALALVAQPQRVLVVGLGGGSLPSLLRKHFPRLVIDVVDIDPVVVEVAKKFFGFREDAAMRVVVDDGRHYLQQYRDRYDIIFLDAFGDESTPYDLTTLEFLQSMRRAAEARRHRRGQCFVGQLQSLPRRHGADLSGGVQRSVHHYHAEPRQRAVLGLAEADVDRRCRVSAPRLADLTSEPSPLRSRHAGDLGFRHADAKDPNSRGVAGQIGCCNAADIPGRSPTFTGLAVAAVGFVRLPAARHRAGRAAFGRRAVPCSQRPAALPGFAAHYPGSAAYAIVAALFAVHPLHFQSVIWISECRGVLGTLCFMLTLLAYQRYALKPSLLRYSLVMLLLALAVLAKPMLMTLPLLLLLLDYWPLERWQAPPSASSEALRRPRRQNVALRLGLEKAPLLGLAAAVAWLAQRDPGLEGMGRDIAFSTPLAGAIRAYCDYVGERSGPADWGRCPPTPRTNPGGTPLSRRQFCCWSPWWR